MSRIKWKTVEPEIDRLLLSTKGKSRTSRAYAEGYTRGLREGFVSTLFVLMLLTLFSLWLFWPELKVTF